MEEKDLKRKKNLKRLFIIGLWMFAVGFWVEIILALIFDLIIDNQMSYPLYVMKDMGLLGIILYFAGKTSLREGIFFYAEEKDIYDKWANAIAVIFLFLSVVQIFLENWFIPNTSNLLNMFFCGMFFAIIPYGIREINKKIQKHKLINIIAIGISFVLGLFICVGCISQWMDFFDLY